MDPSGFYLLKTQGVIKFYAQREYSVSAFWLLEGLQCKGSVSIFGVPKKTDVSVITDQPQHHEEVKDSSIIHMERAIIRADLRIWEQFLAKTEH